jgi:hypothetical protein
MDAVISYVNGCEKVWRTKFNKYSAFTPSKYNWFYDWGTLKYVLRGISTYMPYIDNVFLVVSNIEQVPDYVDQSKVKIVLHKDFIPKKHLPVFQPNTIEIFMHMIPGLGKEFVYFNDDTIPISPISYDDLICDGKPCISFCENHKKRSMSCSIIKNSYTYANIYMNISKPDNYPLDKDDFGICPIHGPTVFLKSNNKNVYNVMKHSFEKKLTLERTNNNINQYVYSDVLYFTKEYVESNLTLTYIRTDDLSADTCKDDISSINTNYLCINDFGSINGLTLKESSDVLQNALNIKLPDKCKYEL